MTTVEKLWWLVFVDYFNSNELCFCLYNKILETKILNFINQKQKANHLLDAN